ncbi:MAG: MBL fold metallo-hydrolase [Calditrichia bacterium]
MQIEYIALGDTDRIGPSAHYLRLGEWGILLDAGLDPGSGKSDKVPDYERIKNLPVNAVIISHAHLDHLGSLPVALGYFPHARVYMTPATAAISEVMLFHYLRVQQRRSMEEKIRFSPLYSQEDAENILYLFQSFGYNIPFKIHSFEESNIEITFRDAGHILGAAGVEINWQGIKIFYTGNTKKSPQFFLKGGSYPASADVLITETTYGADGEAPRLKKAAEVNRFARFLDERLKRGGAVLIPVFALGRTQEIMVLLHRLIQRSKVTAVPVYITGFGNEINKIYDRQLHKVYPEYRTKRLHSIVYNTLRGKRFRKPSIILATSGMMLPNTLSYEIAGDFLLEPRNGIAFVGWADPDTPGGSLREMKMEKVKSIFGVDQILCGMEIFHFSAHSNREELLDLVRRLSARKTILCHGEIAALNWMENAIRERGLSKQVCVPKRGEPVLIEL